MTFSCLGSGNFTLDGRRKHPHHRQFSDLTLNAMKSHKTRRISLSQYVLAVVISELRDAFPKLDFFSAENANFSSLFQIRNVFNFFFVQKIKRKAKLFFVVVILSLLLGQMEWKTRKIVDFFAKSNVHYFMFERKVLQRCKAVLLEEKLKKISINFFCTRTHINFGIYFLRNLSQKHKTWPKLSLNSKVTFSPTERKIKDFSCGMIFPDQFYC